MGAGARHAATAAAFAGLLTGCAGGPAQDADLAYCLSAGQRTRLVDALSALEIARPGSRPGTVLVGTADVALQDWRRDHRDEFDRACDAITPDPPPDEWSTGLLAALNVLIGGLLALGSAWLTARSARRRQVGDALRDAVQRLVRSIDAFVLVQTGGAREGPTVATLLDQLATVDAAARRAGSEQRRPGAGPAIEALDAVSSVISKPWPDPLDEGLQERGRAVRDSARRAHEAAEALAAALDRPWARSRR